MMVLAVGLSQYNVAIMHLVLHAMYKAGLFLAAGSVLHSMGDQQDFRRYGGLVKILPLTYTVILIASLSLAAFPWLSGYFSKDVRDRRLLIVSWNKLYHFSYMIITSELVVKVSFIMNRASLTYISKVKYIINLNRYIITWVISSMIKTILFEVHYSLAFTGGLSLVRNETFEIVNSLSLWLLTREIYTGWVRNALKNKNEQSKEDLRINKTTVGLSVVQKDQDNRVIIVPFKKKKDTIRIRIQIWIRIRIRIRCILCMQDPLIRILQGRGRITANNIFQFRYYNTRCIKQKSNIINKLNNLYMRSKNKPNLPIDRNLYNLISNIDMLKLAYENLNSKSDYLTDSPDIGLETLDRINIDKLDKLSENLKSEKFQFSGSRRINILKLRKSSNNTKSLPIASLHPFDKLILEGMRLILNAIYEPLFLESSHGFRPNKSRYTALNYINKKFQGCNWFIEGDISNSFDSIDHHLLVNLIETKIKDRKFTKLIWKSLRAGYFEFKRNPEDIVEEPQGSIISPILANIYLHEFDNFIVKLQNNFNVGKENRHLSSYNKLGYEINKAKKEGDMKLVLKLVQERRKLLILSENFSDSSYKCLYYVRYADNWIIGIKGTIKEVKEIRNTVKAFLLDLKLELNEMKTNITNINSNYAKFLGVKIIRAKDIKYIKISKSSSINFKPRRLQFMAPLVTILKKLRKAGFMSNGCRKSYPKFVWMHLDHPDILYLYNSVIRKYLNYYYFVNNYSYLVSTLIHILKGSCAKLLAAKFSLKTQAKVYKKFGNNLTYQFKKEGKVKKISFFVASPVATLLKNESKNYS